MTDDYPNLNRRWNRAEAQAAYDATRPAAWAMLFWDAVSIKLRRTGTATHRQLAIRWGWPAKVTRTVGERKVCRCGAAKAFKAVTCRQCWRLHAVA